MSVATENSLDLVRWFEQISMDDVAIVGGKNASLGEMYRELTPQGIRIPNGFATTAAAYRTFLAESGLDEKIPQILSGMNVSDVGNLQHHAMIIRHMILETPLPDLLSHAIVAAYHQLCDASSHQLADVAVRSSATAEDLPDASFAGQQETYLNVRGQATLLDACRRCFASLFTDRAISYRAHHGYDHMQVALSIGVQKMVRSDLASSGVMFSIDTESGFRNAVLINAAYGLGENVVQGSVNPDEYYVFKPTLLKGHRPILKKSLGSKSMKLVYDAGGSKMTKNIPVSPEQSAQYAISDDDILQLAQWACAIENHYSQRKGSDCPMDMEWAKDGNTGELFIVQARPETVQSRRSVNTLERYHLKGHGKLLLKGRSIGEKIASGPVRLIRDIHELATFQQGEILVTDKTDPDWEPVMKQAAGIITNRGGRTCHAAIVSREIGLPAIVGTGNATDILQDGQVVTISCAEGDAGIVYEGELGFDVESIDLGALRRPKTKIMMNVASPDEAFAFSMIPNDGVGLAREEFIIGKYVKVHPQALLGFDDLDETTRLEVETVTRGYEDKPQFYIDKLAEGIAMICAAFYPKDVIVRLSDFKTNEYAGLIGGASFEPSEANPMIGFRGASRYYHPSFQEAFGLECKAVQKVRHEMGLNNLKLMVPFCRTIEEGQKVQAEMSKYGLVRGQDGLEIYVMCEIPSNVILADQFAEIFDGFSIGSNDLTQLTLGVDRDSEIVAHVFDERNEAVKRMIHNVIGTAKSAGAKIGICGQAPSDYPDFAEFLVREGIDSISLTPDAVLKTTIDILQVEEQLSTKT
ncbi:phosphoenolpyruvate synthase [Aporhodopirellula aestuarii]|uniref:Phosphoenolpyruvate synthase n=1 Tax=Aporhodopirellula aestuarii TaxID=2950107 RepID=A0ABT0TYV3_9BACT|nr:phosphoenolpyruvate synthase [Aporhodopirellula aestuarii]MCM2369715.1 phosphoenolpyruvate synthase [Aporhodopirellula aestuarii]